jgi:signal transduction histidine kinase
MAVRAPALARGYLWLVALAAIAVQAALLVAWREPRPIGLGLAGLSGLLVAMAVLAQHFPVVIGRDRKVDVSTAAYFACVLLFSPPLAVALVGLSQLLGQFTLARRRNPVSGRPLRTARSALFNTGQAMVATAASALAYRAFVPEVGALDRWANLWAIPAAAAAMYLANGFAVAVMVALQHGQNPVAVWAQGRRRNAVEFAGLFLIGVVIARAGARDPLIDVAMVLPAAIIYWSMDRTVRLEEAARREAEIAAWRDLEHMKNEFMRSISHEIRTPLSIVRGYAELLYEEAEGSRTAEGTQATAAAERSPASLASPASTPQIREFAGQVYTHARLLTRLIDDLLDFARIETGDVVLEPEDFDLVPVLHDLVAGLRRQPGGERIVVELPQTLPVRADPGRVAQAVFNLITNAQKYAPDGPITLRAGPVVGPHPVHPVGAVRIEVVDRGPGIPVEEQPRVWQKFYRGERVAGLNVVPGAGLGLAIVKALTEAQGGRVGLESVPGRGARFWVELPVAVGGGARRRTGRTASVPLVARLVEHTNNTNATEIAPPRVDRPADA